jgi:ferric-dicitrate binding protein FerR (iron transport regulator)
MQLHRKSNETARWRNGIVTAKMRPLRDFVEFVNTFP